MKPFSFHREALEEFDAAAIDHARKAGPVVAHRFYQVIDGLIADACRMPGTFRSICGPARRHFSREFPYGIIYIERPTEIWIVAVVPLRRKPGYWTHRLAGDTEV